MRVFLSRVSVAVTIGAAMLAIGLVSKASAEGRRVALVIGNQAYAKLTPLANPVLDATRMAAVLSANGFEVLSCDGDTPGCFDLDRNGMTDALEDFEDLAKGASVAFVFYAGHGMQTADGNVLAPVNMELDCDSLDPRRALLLDNVMEAAEGAAEKIVVIDACRNDPFQAKDCATRGGRPLSFDSIRLPAEAERFLLVSSTTPGQVARDGLPGAHSPFAASLFKMMEGEPELRFDQLFARAVKDVIETTAAARSTQVPETLTRGAAPESCLSGSDCAGDPLAGLLKDEVEALKLQYARAQEYEEIVTVLLREAGYSGLEELPEAERASFFRGIVEASRALSEKGQDGERALEALKRGDTQEAEALFRQETARLDREIEDERRNAADAYRHLGALARASNVAEAADHYAKAAERDPGNIDTWMDLADAAQTAGRSSQALEAYRAASRLARDSDAPDAGKRRFWAAVGEGDIVLAQGRLDRALSFYEAARGIVEKLVAAAPDDSGQLRNLSVIQNRIGDVWGEQGKLAAALEAYEAALDIAVRLADSDAGNASWQSDVTVSRDRIGDVRMNQGKLAEALESYEVSLAIRQRFVDWDPANAYWQADLSISYGKVGNVRVAQGNIGAAVDAFEAAREIRQRLADADPGNALRQRDLSVSYTRIGDVRIAQGNIAGGLEAFETTLEIVQRLTDADPGNNGWWRDLAIAHNRIGSTRVALGNLAGALESYEASRAITQRLVATDGSNTTLQRDLSIVEEIIGEVRIAQGDLNAALKAHEASLAIRQRLSAAAPDNASWLRDVSVSFNKIGNVRLDLGDLPGAQKAYEADLDIARRLADSDPDNTAWQHDLSVSHEKVGNLKVAQQDLAGGLEAYEASFAIRKRLTAADPGHAGWQRDLAVSLSKIGDVRQDQDDLDGAMQAYEESLAIRQKLAAADPSNADWQRDLSVSQTRVGDVLILKGDLPAGRGAHEIAMEIVQRLADSDPDNANWQWDLYVGYWRIAQNSDRQVEYFAKALDVIERLHSSGRLAPSKIEWIEATRKRLGEAQQEARQQP